MTLSIRYDSYGTQLEGELSPRQRAAIMELGFHYFPLGKFYQGQYSDYWQCGVTIPPEELEFALGESVGIQNESAEDYQDRKGA